MTAVVLLALGAHDLCAALLPERLDDGRRRTLGCLTGLTAAGLLALAVFLASGAAATTLAAGLLALGLLLIWVYGGADRPLVSVGVIAAVGLLAVGEATGFLPGREVWPAPVVMLAAGLALIETSNRITRDVLALAGRPEASFEVHRDGRREADRRAPGPRRTRSSGASSGGGSPTAAAQPELAQAEVEVWRDARRHATADPGAAARTRLRGGRYIGPMERVLMAALGLAGAFHVIGAVMAAKGIVRFPEISRGGGDGHQAEEFLVGSLTSWLLAAAAAFLAHAALHPA